jgi:hypothetical protein
MYQSDTAGASILIANIVPIIITIPGFTPNRIGNITDLSVPTRLAGKALDVITTFENTGNCRIMDASCFITIKDSSGNVKWQDTADVPAPSILPTFSRDISLHDAAGLAAGTYNVTAEIKSGGTVLSTKTVTFEIVQPPAAPTLVKPGNTSQPGPYIDTPTPVFEWDSVAIADLYNLFISADPFTPDNSVYDQPDLTGTSLTLAAETIFPDTKFAWKMRAHNTGGWGDYSSEFYFRTSGPAPVVTSSEARDITVTGATLNGNLEALGWQRTSAVVSFEYGETTQYGSSTTDQTLTAQGIFQATLADLKQNTVYHFRAKAVGASTVYGDDLTFTTGVPLVVSSGVATNITENGATLNATLVSLDSSGSAVVNFEYGTTTDYGDTTGPQTMNNAGPFNVSVTGLKEDTTYHFRAKAVGLNTVYGKDVVFTTMKKPGQTTTTTTTTTTTSQPGARSYNDFFPPVIVASSLTYQDFNDPSPNFNAVDKTGAQIELTGTNNKDTITIIAAKYNDEPQVAVHFSSGITKGGTGKPWIKFIGVGVEGAKQGNAVVTLHFTSKEVSGYNLDSLFLSYFYSGKWRTCNNIKISAKDGTISGEIPVSRLAKGVVIGMGDQSKTSAEAAPPINNKSEPRGISWSLIGIIIVPIIIIGIAIVLIAYNRKRSTHISE